MRVSFKTVDYKKMMIFAVLLAMLGLCISMMQVQSGSVPTIIIDEEIFGTGLKEASDMQKGWMAQNVPAVASVKMNSLALERLNHDRILRGLSPLTATDVGAVGDGEELVYSGSSELLGEDMLPSSVDNSKSIYFPPIRSQGSLGSCVAWSTTYYTFTYETNFAQGRAANTGDNNVIFSPKWTYNMINFGANSGAYFSDAFYLLTKHGAVTWAEFPYDTNYLQWCMNTTAWRSAINYRAESWSQIYNPDTTVLIEQLKTQLANGHVMVIGTYVSSWVSSTIKNDPATAEDDAFVNQRIATYMKNTRLGGHGMTLVGYNDEIWCDLNGDGNVDSGEKGAFKIANSWGTGDWNAGFRWVTYDSLYGTSQVHSTASWPTTDRYSYGIFRGGDMYSLTVRETYTPKLVAEFTINHLKRSQLYMTLGVGEVTTSTVSSSWYPEAIYGSGGSYAFDGTTTAKDGTFVMDFTDLVPSTTALKRWFVGMRDSATGDYATIKSFKLFQVTATSDVLVGTSTAVPKAVDGGQAYAWVDYQYNSQNTPPTASFGASPTSGVAPLMVYFDGSASSDSDGRIASYQWSFGDGYSAYGVSVSHTYTTAGSYTATLTVTDDDGSKSTASKILTVQAAAANAAPDATFTSTVTSGVAPLVVSFDGSASKDSDGTIVSYAWSFGDGGSGAGMKVSHTYANTGTFTTTLTVMDDDGAADMASVMITVSEPPANVAPTAVIKTNASSGEAPVSIAFDGSGSTDPEGAIATYQWNFGDGMTASGVSTVHVYAEEGVYTAVLTVTDSAGAKGNSSVVITVSAKAPEALIAPSNLVARVSLKTVTLTWKDNSNIENGFYIYRATRITGSTYTAFTIIGEVSANTITFKDITVTGTYRYQVCAFNTYGLSGFSNLVSARVK
jgi:PKD repeat protein